MTTPLKTIDEPVVTEMSSGRSGMTVLSAVALLALSLSSWGLWLVSSNDGFAFGFNCKFNWTERITEPAATPIPPVPPHLHLRRPSGGRKA